MKLGMWWPSGLVEGLMKCCCCNALESRFAGLVLVIAGVRYFWPFCMQNDFARNGFFPSLYCAVELYGDLDGEILFWIQNKIEYK